MSNEQNLSSENNVVAWRKRIYWPENVFEKLVQEAAQDRRDVGEHIVYIVERHFGITPKPRKEG